MNYEVLALATRKIHHSIDSLHARINVVVHYHNLVAIQQQLQSGMAANVTCPSCYQYAPFRMRMHHSVRHPIGRRRHDDPRFLLTLPYLIPDLHLISVTSLPSLPDLCPNIPYSI